MPRPIRVSFVATTLSGLTHVTEFDVPGVIGDDQINSIDVVMRGERICTLKWEVQLRPPEPRVTSFTRQELAAALDEAELPADSDDDEDDDSDDDDDEDEDAEAEQPKPEKNPKKDTE